jgi:hypothetical protein
MNDSHTFVEERLRVYPQKYDRPRVKDDGRKTRAYEPLRLVIPAYSLSS